ncbi:hypothetical protein [Larkinella soli]|uniref:hypothetical protein n=1 Tax=Larkinella soli TaxID=1770527 RepID=UPI000FFBB259|nr:hypothetical protein [Larkinella soli]
MTAGAQKIISQFRQLSSDDRRAVLRELNRTDWETEFEQLNRDLPNVEISMQEIISEVKAARRAGQA